VHQRIPTPFRIALAAKALLLLGLGAAFGVLVLGAVTQPGRSLIFRVLAAAVFGVIALFLAGSAMRGVFDVVLGQALQATGVVALPSRRSGLSMRLPDGRLLEFILWNPWEPLRADVTYSVTYGKFSGVLVRPPLPETQREAV
jgi:hypothetical protein